jgi:hypothetical protein
MTAQDVIAASIWRYEREIAGMPPTDWATWSRRDPETAAIYACHAGSVLAGLRAAGLAVVPVRLLEAAYACMRETGWQLAPAHLARGSDGILETACAEVCEQVGELLTAAQEETK